MMDSPVANRLLSALSTETRDRILLRGTAVALPLRFSLFRPEEMPEYAYFMTSGLASIVMTTGDGSTAEVSVVGREGLVGVIHLLGPVPGSLTAFIQMEGTGIRVPMSDLKTMFRSNAEITDRLLEFTQVQLLTISNTVGCNLLHQAEARLARWLLTADDRSGAGDSLSLTQEFLGTMLGVRRTTVNLVISALEGRGLIHSVRGRIRIVNREQLEQAACDCYQVTRRLQENLYQTHYSR
jgi:CRP-like cAMP-binding protein